MTQIDFEAAKEMEERYDPEIQFRPVSGAAKWLVGGLLVFLSAFHYYTAGFGILEHHWHTGVHLAFVLGLIFIVFSANRGRAGQDQNRGCCTVRR